MKSYHPQYIRGIQRLFRLNLGNATWTKADKAALLPEIHRFYGKKSTKPKPPKAKKCCRR